MKTVVIGGTGLVGSRLVTRLLQLGHHAIPASPASGVNTVTGEGLADAIFGASVVIDVSNAISFDETIATAFFTTSTLNQTALEAAYGVRHHVTLSVVGTRQDSAVPYFRAKFAQEDLIRQSFVPYTIVQATQFFEFVGFVADTSTVDDTVRVPPVLIQPIAADDVVTALLDAVFSPPENGSIEVAGPEQFRLDDLIRRQFRARRDDRTVIADADATYFGAKLATRSLLPNDRAKIGVSHFDEWLQPVPRSGTPTTLAHSFAQR